MRKVMQGHKRGCGVACVAMVVGLSYWQTFHEFPLDVQDRISRDIKGTTTGDLRKVLAAFGHKIPARRTPTKKWPKEPCIAAVDVKRNGNWHWVIWTGRRILDPARSFHTTEDSYSLSGVLLIGPGVASVRP